MNYKKLVGIIIAVLVVTFVIYRFAATPQVKVKKVSVSKGEVVRTVSASGYVKSPVEASLGFPMGGKIVNVYKKEGDTVQQGELIAQVYNEDLYFDAESARKRKDSAQRTRDIYSDSNSRNQNDSEYKLNFDKLTDDLRVYDNAYKSALSDLKKTYIYAPFDGTITSLSFRVGEIAGASTIAKLSNLDMLGFQADLDQEDYKFVKIGQESEIVLDAYPIEKFKGKVETVPTFVDEESSTKTFKLKINIPNKDNKIVKGMTGDVNIVVAKESANKVLPFDAIFSDTGDKKFVWVVNKDNKLEKKFIEVGLEGDTMTSIKTDLPEYVVIPDSTAKNVKEGNSVTF